MPTPRPRIRRDGTVLWQVPIRIAREGRVVQSSKSFPTLEAAIGWAQLVDKLGVADAVALLEFQRGSTAAPATVTDWLNTYVDHLTGVEPYTKRKYRAYIVNDIAPFMGHLPLDAVTQFTDAAWVLWLEEKGNSGKTIANKHGFFAAAMAAAARMRPKPLIAYNPCEGIRLPRHDAPEMVFFEPAEYALFLSAMPQRWHAQTEFCLASMASPSEVGALTVGDINQDTGGVRINKAFKYTGTGWRLGPPKTKRGVRTVNVPIETIELLDLDRPHDTLLFHTRRGTPIRAAYFYQEAILPALRELIEVDDQGNVVVDRLAGKRPSPYTLRHTGISWRLLGGVPMFVVSRDAGHDSYDTTDKRYGHLDRTASAAAAKVIAAKIPRLNNLPDPKI